MPNSCEQYVEIYKAGVHDALPRVRCAETIVPWLICYRKSRVFTLIESMCRSGKAALLEAGRLEPEVSDTSSVPWQVLPFVQSIEVVDRDVSYWFGFRQA